MPPVTQLRCKFCLARVPRQEAAQSTCMTKQHGHMCPAILPQSPESSAVRRLNFWLWENLQAATGFVTQASKLSGALQGTIGATAQVLHLVFASLNCTIKLVTKLAKQLQKKVDSFCFYCLFYLFQLPLRRLLFRLQPVRLRFVPPRHAAGGSTANASAKQPWELWSCKPAR